MCADFAESGRGKSLGGDGGAHTQRSWIRKRKIYAAERNDREGIMSMSHRHISGSDHGRHSVTAAVFGIGVGIGVHQEDDVHALHAPVLVLNASYEPINVCAARRAIVLVLKGVAMTEEENGHFLH